MNRTWFAVMSVVGGCAIASPAFADIINVPADQPTIQAGIDAAVDGDEVVVADGTYTGPGNRDMDFGGKFITVRSENGAEACIIDLQANESDPHRAFDFHSGETAASVVQGFTIQNGFMNRGGAVLCEGSSPLFQSCIFQQNTAWVESPGDGGGAVYNLGSSPTFNACQFLENHAEVNIGAPVGGGAMQNHSGSSVTLNSCEFIDNSATQVGVIAITEGSAVIAHDCEFRGNTATGGFVPGEIGGIVIAFESSGTFVGCRFIGNVATDGCCGAMLVAVGSTAEFTDCTFLENSAVGDGGGVAVQHAGSNAILTNCLFAGNQSSARGGGLWVGEEAEATVINCTFSGNTATVAGSALAVRHSATVAVDNSILWNNAPDPFHVFNSVLTVSYSDIEGGWGGTGNIAADPMFVDIDGPDNNPNTWEDNDFRLSTVSPAIDAADNTAVPKDITTDLDGNPRFIEDANTPDTGLGNCPIVDMGSYEFQEGTVNCCPADFDNSGDVGVKDLLFLLGAWGPCPKQGDCPADFDNSGDVGVKDLLVLLGAWGPCPL